MPITGLILATLVMVGRADTAKPRREATEWCNIWVPQASSTELPRVLLVGDSITVGYYAGVEKALHARAAVAHLATSAAVGDSALLDQLRLILSQYRFEVVHINVGLHGMDYTEAEYRARLSDVIRVVKSKAPGARLIWATTTPWRKSAPDTCEFHENNERVRARNRIAAELMAKWKIETDDLFGLVESHPEYWADDGVHFNAQGQAAEAAQVSTSVARALDAARR